MSRTLNLIDRLLARGRDLQQLGRDREAVRLLRRLAGFRELPAEAAEETQVRLAEIYLRHRRYHQARRHLTAALRHRPASARYHYLMATAVEAEDTGDPRRAARHYRRALQLEPDRPDCLVDYGLLNLREGRTEAGLTCLRRAVELAPGDAEVVGKLATALTAAGRSEEARAVLRAALFRNPRDGRFRRLWDEFQFRRLVRRQKEARRQKRREAAAGPVLLPFVRPAFPAGCPRILRPDGLAPVPAPHGPRLFQLSDQRHAQ
ncbi:MAG TPA: tetratricopeptide repeat protein [Gemmataceae bacterium]|jgi:Tfp pilus assembly protein PilF|nr:tetratricopeptide repeat protein [Gemmataceae bacterium]